MASLQTLRNKGGIIVAVVIGLALISFVLGDLLTSGSTLFSGGQNVGEINGTTIPAQQYQEQVTLLTDVLKVSTGSETITDEQSQQVQAQAWEQLIMRYAITPEFSDLGITVGVEEMAQLLTGSTPSPMVQQIFFDPSTGMFDPALVRQFLSNIDQDPTGRMQSFWDNLQSDVHNSTQMMKYKALVDKGNYITSAQANFMAEVEGASYNVRFVAEKLSNVPDSLVQVSESAIKSYYDANSVIFERPESRSINYVVFEALPSDEDYKSAAKYMSDLKEEFEVATDVKQFASLNSENPYDNRYYKKEELSTDLGNFAYSAEVDEIYAPEMAGDKYILARIADKKVVPDSINFSHILLETADKQLADSLYAELKKTPSKFSNFVAVYSKDNNSRMNGGLLGSMDPQTLLPQFSESMMSMNNGEIRLIELPTTIHIVKVNSKIGNSQKVQLAKIEYTVEASEETRANTFNNASSFASRARTAGFAQGASDSMLSVRNAELMPSSRELQGYENSREAVRWTYAAEVGDISDVMEFGDSFIVATLTQDTPEGIAPLNDVREQIQNTLLTESKAQKLATEMTGSVDEIAANKNLEVITGNDINFTTYIAPEIGFDPSFAGGVSALSKGQTSKPIEGKAAVYVVEVTDVISNPVSTAMVKERLKAESEQSTFYNAYQSILKGSEISDERYKFF